MVALLSSGDRAKRDVRWGLVAYTMALFSFLTIALGIDLYLDRTLFIDNREFPGNDISPPGPLGYSDSITYDVINLVYFILYPLTQWLNDGFLVCSTSNTVVLVLHLYWSSSCIVAASFTP